MAAVESIDQKILDVQKRIDTERKMLEASRAIKVATRNQDVLRRTDNQIREAERSLLYFENMLQDLNTKKRQGSYAGSLSSGSTSSSAPVNSLRGSMVDPNRSLPPTPDSSIYGSAQYSTSGAPTQTHDFSRTRYSNLDLLKADTPHTPAKISRMLHQLEYKLQMEMQYKKGISQIAYLYQQEGDRKSRQDAESKKVENEKKIQLLQMALKRYKNLHVLEVDEEEEDLPLDTERKNFLRKLQSGKLIIGIKGAQGLDHAPIVKRGSKGLNDTTVVVKIEGTQRAKSHPSRTDRWNEDFEIPIDKENEIEITIYDKQGNDPSVPVGLLWIRVSDLVEALRRQKVGDSGAGWVTAAGAMGGSLPGQPVSQYSPQGMDAPVPLSGPTGQVPPAPPRPGTSEGIDGWFTVEPAGAIALRLDFAKENVKKRQFDAGQLGRQGAVRRKEEIHEMNGHKFVVKQFYQIIMCAFCSEFLFNAVGYQCEDCSYTCHKKCYEKVLTKCISKSSSDADGDEEKINHRIPHRFAPITNLSANWCCHCGYMLPLGRKNARRCTECQITCHASCAHLVPDLCGMPMEVANELLRNWKEINRGKLQPKSTRAAIRDHPDSIETRVDRLALEPDMVYSQGMEITQDESSQSRFEEIPDLDPQLQHSLDVMGDSSKDSYPQSWESRDHTRLHHQKMTMEATAIKSQGPASPTISDAVVTKRDVKKPHRKVGLDDFNFLAVLGKGNFGKVMLAEEKLTSQLFAIKVLKKEFIIDNDEVESTRSEKRVFLTAAKERHPFLLGLHSCFQTETRIYFVMEYVSGGDLMLHIQRKQFSLRQAKFYACEVLLALEYFHANGIIYRDLKLDNILLTLDGHVKVADYGLCKEEMWYGKTTSTFCGTPEFMAPEILLEQRYGRAVDWWAFGVLTYEMLLGQSPFRGDDEDEIFDAILEDEPLYPITMPRDAVSVLQKLLNRDPTRRLGSGKEDAEEIKRHPFFRDVNFDDVLHKRIPPPYFPTINGAADTSNFDEEFTREQPTLTPVHGQLSSRDQKEFAGFSWVANWAGS